MGEETMPEDQKMQLGKPGELPNQRLNRLNSSVLAMSIENPESGERVVGENDWVQKKKEASPK